MATDEVGIVVDAHRGPSIVLIIPCQGHDITPAMAKQLIKQGQGQTQHGQGQNKQGQGQTQHGQGQNEHGQCKIKRTRVIINKAWAKINKARAIRNYGTT